MKQLSIHILNFILFTSLIISSNYQDTVTLPVKLSKSKVNAHTQAGNIKFLKATKAENSNILVWRTTKGIEVDHFIIERSEDQDENFETITEVRPNKPSKEKNVHEYQDEDFKPISFYRIKMVDKNGGFKYTQTLRVTRTIEDLKILNIHHTETGSFTVRYKTPESSEDLRLYLSDLDGNVIWMYAMLEPGGDEAVTIHTLFYYQGLYQINLSDNKHTTSQKIII